MWVESVTTGSPKVSRRGCRGRARRGMRSRRPLCAPRARKVARTDNPPPVFPGRWSNPDQRARALARKRSMIFRPWIEVLRESESERKGCDETRRLLPLDSAPSGSQTSADDSEQALDLNPNRSDISNRCDFGGDQQHFSDLASGRAPFTEPPMLTRENMLGYSWPPHLYQGLFQSRGKTGESTAESAAANARSTTDSGIRKY